MSRSLRTIASNGIGLHRCPDDGKWLEEFHEQVCGRVVGALVRRGWRSDAAWDAVGDILVDILSGELQPAHGDQLGAWVFVVAKRRLISASRRRQPVPLDENDPAAVLEPLDNLLRQEQSESLRAAIRSLTEKEHAVIIGRFVDGLSHAELARRHRTSEGAVRRRIFRARRKLEQLLIS